MNPSDLSDFATRYAAAWSGQNPEDLASFYAEDGSLTVNAGEPSVGRAAIAATAGAYMEAFPDMVVRMDSVSQEGDRATFHWTWTGTNTGPGGTGRDGFVVVDRISQIGLEDVTPSLARRSGFNGVVDLLKVARHGSGENVYLVEFHYEPGA